MKHTAHDDKMLILALRDQVDALIDALDDLMGVALRAPSCMESDCRICPVNRAAIDKARTLLVKGKS